MLLSLALPHPHLNPQQQDKFFQPCECCLEYKTKLDLMPIEYSRTGSLTPTCLSRQEHQSLLEKLSALEKKVIVGGVDLLAKAEEQEKLLEESNMELEERRKRAEQLRKELEEKEVGLSAVAVCRQQWQDTAGMLPSCGSALEALQKPPLHRSLIGCATPAALSQPDSARALCSWRMLCSSSFSSCSCCCREFL